MDDKRYTLMNKNRPVLDFLYNLDTHHVVKILKRRELDFAPPAILDMKGNPTRAALLENRDETYKVSVSFVTLSRLRTPGLHRYSAPATAFGAMLNR